MVSVGVGEFRLPLLNRHEARVASANGLGLAQEGLVVLAQIQRVAVRLRNIERHVDINFNRVALWICKYTDKALP